MHYPENRMRRLRTNEPLRRLVAETSLSVNNLIFPLFVCHGTNVRQPIAAMPEMFRMSVDACVEECARVRDLGIPAVILFGIPAHKDETGSEASDDNGIIQTAVRKIKSEVSGLLVITDVCLCEYTSHGHCGIIVDGAVDTDATLPFLAKQALSHAQAGADMVAPSDMMDGRVGAIRNALDAHGYVNLPILAYSAKYASAFYGPFREAAGSTPAYGDRKSYQMDPGNGREAIREAMLDIGEGADIIMVKPALSYLDIVYRIKKECNVPVAAYSVSGEYACIKAAAQNGWIDGEKCMMESLLSIKRAGADMIITYFAKEAAQLLR
jgi:porphobilinogen synthase